MLETLVNLDKELFLYLNNLGTPTWDGFWMFYTTKINWAPFYAVILYFLYKRTPGKAFIITVITVALMITFTDQVTNLFKNGVARFRPCYDPSLEGLMRLVKDGCGFKYGYFSGHSSNSMAVAIFCGLSLRNRFKYILPGLIVWSLFMGYSRIYIGVHFPLDVLSGFTLGALAGYGFYKLHNYLQCRFSAKKTA